MEFRSEEEIQSWIILLLASALEIDANEIDINQPLASYGLDSATAVNLTGQMSDQLAMELEPTLFWDYPTIESIAQYFFEQLSLSAQANTSPNEG